MDESKTRLMTQQKNGAKSHQESENKSGVKSIRMAYKIVKLNTLNSTLVNRSDH